MTNHIPQHDRDQHREKRNRTTAQETLKFDCEYCDEVLSATTAEAIKNQGTTHLEAHKDTLLEAFGEKTRGKHCQNDCGYVFVAGSEAVSGFGCPKCGYDNFEAFANRYIYWQIEYP